MLSKKTKYAFHALTFLAKQKTEAPIVILTIAKSTKIPRKFLENILLELKKAGFLGSKMGKGGGYYLMKSPSEIKLSAIIRMFNGPIAYLPCVSLNYYEKCAECEDEIACGIHFVMLQHRNEALKILENKSIQDILDHDTQSIYDLH